MMAFFNNYPGVKKQKVKCGIYLTFYIYLCSNIDQTFAYMLF